MPTRATFWIGDPRNLDSREWLGASNYDGYPDGYPLFEVVESAEDFRFAIEESHKGREFVAPGNGWPYSWQEDIFATDFTYAFFDGEIQVTCYRSGFQPWAMEMHWPDGNDATLWRIPAPCPYNPALPDGFIRIPLGWVG